MTIAIDDAWCNDNPLPPSRSGLDKNARGQVLVIGGSSLVPGVALLTGEAALRAGAGKVQLATIEAAAIPIGVAFPESAVIALPVDPGGEISTAALDRLTDEALDCDALVIGPGMRHSVGLAKLVEAVLARLPDGVPALLDAGAIATVADIPQEARSRRRLIITPHHGELGKLENCGIDAVAANPEGAARTAADRYGVTVVLKAAETFVAPPGGETLRYLGKAKGLGTAGSGDVLAGVIGGLLARGVPPVDAVAWGVRAHGEAGTRADSDLAPLGYLARDLLPHLPARLTRTDRGRSCNTPE